MSIVAALGIMGGGLVVSVGGAELLVRGASRLAALWGVPPLIIGLTIVAFGTSAPELAVSISAATSGQADIAMGNVVGSNIFNVLFILGLSALIVPLAVDRQLLRVDVPVMMGVSGLLWLLAWNGAISRGEGALLLAGIAAYTWLQIRLARRDRPVGKDEFAVEFTAPPSRGRGPLLWNVGAIVVGLALLVVGARGLVHGAATIARAMGVSELVIGLTIIAAGTSLPEVLTSIVAAMRRERDIAVGNIVGSNIFNVLAVLGAAAVLAPVQVAPQALAFDIPFAVAVAVACLPVFLTGMTIARWEGAVFLGYYVLYTSYLVLAAVRPLDVPAPKWVLLMLAAPLVVLTLAVLLIGGRGPAPGGTEVTKAKHL